MSRYQEQFCDYTKMPYVMNEFVRDVIHNTYYVRAKFLRQCAWDVLNKLTNPVEVIAMLRDIPPCPNNFVLAEDLLPIDPEWCKSIRFLIMKLKETGYTFPEESIVIKYALIQAFKMNPLEDNIPFSSLDYFLNAPHGVVNSLMEKYQAEVTPTNLTPAIHIAYTFRNKSDAFVQAFIAWKNDPEIVGEKALHDAGQLKPIKLPGEWQDFFVSRPSLYRYYHRYEIIQEILGRVPTSIDEFNAALDEAKSKGLIPSLDNPVFDNMSEDELETYTEFMEENKPKEECFVPAPGGLEGVTAGKYTIKQLAIGDAAALAIGEVVNCCQHLNGVGSSCAKESYTNPKAAIWVAYSGPDIIAESYVWRYNNVLVLDSVEGFNRDGLPELFKAAAEAVVGIDGVEAVLVPSTNSGFTSAVFRIANHIPITVPNKCPSSYSDGAGKESRVLASIPNFTNISDVKPAKRIVKKKHKK